MKDRHEWADDGQTFLAAIDGLAKECSAEGRAWTESLAGIVENDLELAAFDWPGSVEDAITSADEFSHAAAREILRLVTRVQALEAERDRAWDRVVREQKRKDALSVAFSSTERELRATIRSMEKAVAPLLPLFWERAKRWEVMNRLDGTDFLPMPDAITLTAEFPTAALRALIDRNEQKEEE